MFPSVSQGYLSRQTHSSCLLLFAESASSRCMVAAPRDQCAAISLGGLGEKGSIASTPLPAGILAPAAWLKVSHRRRFRGNRGFLGTRRKVRRYTFNLHPESSEAVLPSFASFMKLLSRAAHSTRSQTKFCRSLETNQLQSTLFLSLVRNVRCS